MKRFLSMAVVVCMILSMLTVAFAESGAEYIAAPFNPAEIDPRATYLEPAFYENENGPTIGVTTVGVIKVDGLYFKDSNNNQELDAFEDWRLTAEERATDLVSKMTLVDQAGFVYNALLVNPVTPKLDAVKNEDGTINPALVFPMVAEGEQSQALTQFNEGASYFAANDDQVLTVGKIRCGIYRGGLNMDASVVALYANIANQIIEWDSAKNGVPSIPYTMGSNPISAGFPDSLGMAAAVIGDGNFDAIRDYAAVDAEMWRAEGLNYMYGPQIDLVTDPRWPRNNGTYGEREDIVAGIITALVDGYQNGTNGVNEKSVMLSAKHFPGDGAAENGFESHTAQGQWRLYPTEGSLEKYQLVGFQAAIDAGVGAIMPCYSRDCADERSVTQSYRGHEVAVNQLGSAYNKEIITTLLRDVMGFDGFVNTDSGITQVQNYGAEALSNLERATLLIQAGSDAIGGELAPERLVEAVETGMLDKADLDRATYNRSLQLFKQGLFENDYLDYMKADEVRATNIETAFAQAYDMHLKATVLLKNVDGTLPLAKDAGTKLFIKSFDAVGGNDDEVAALAELFTAQGFEIVDSESDCDVAYLYVTPKSSVSTAASETEGVLSLVEDFEVAQRDISGEGAIMVAGMMMGGASQAKTGEIVEVTTLADVKKIAKIADKVHENGGKVVATIVVTQPWILDALEPYVDALTVQYTTSAASIKNAYAAQVDVLVGNYNPTGKLSVTMVSCEAVVALTETTLADGTAIEACASPNDVPGYAKDQYIAADVLAQSPSGSYAYQDTEGNLYVSGFGLSY